jgi:DNA-binding CsgD family transcriptional regulator/tetratricopeptide (TPR) repeat protein
MAGDVFVGRQRELAFLQQRVDAARQGEGGLVFVTGEGGIGKTRLAREVRLYAQEREFLWLEGRYLRDENILFQPWVEAIRTFLATASPNMMEKSLLPHGAVLARLVPEVAETLGKGLPLPSIGPEEERLRLFEALAGFFTGIARQQPLVLFLDDLQWAPSIDALHHLARSVATERLLVLGAYREAELMEKPALARTFLAMNRERLFHSLPLKRLAEGEVGRMVAQALGEEASAGLAGLVYQKTEGNPFFVEEVVRYFRESEAIILGEKGWEVKDTTLAQLPYSVKSVVGERLERLGEQPRGILAWASVVGQEFSLPLLQEVTGLEEEKLLEVVDQAVAARVLLPSPSLRQEAYGFADEVVRDVLYEGIGPARRRRYHLKVGQGIEKVHVRRLEEHYDALARHFLEGNGLEKAEEYALKAGDRASSLYSWERAIGHYETALELLEELEANPGQQAEVLEKLALVTGLGRGKGSLGYWEKALSIYEALEDRVKAAQVHLGLARRLSAYEVGMGEYGKAYFHSLKAVELLEAEGESPLLAQAYARLGLNAAIARPDPLSSAIALAEKGVALAQRFGDAAAVREAERLLGLILFYAGEVKRSLELLHQSWEEARGRGDLFTPAEVSWQLSWFNTYLRDTDVALQWAQRAVAVARQSAVLRHQIYSAGALAWASILGGDALQALTNLERAQQRVAEVGVDPSVGTAAVGIAAGVVPFLLGDWEKAEAELLQRLEVANQGQFGVFSTAIPNALAELHLEIGDLARAQAHLQGVVGHCEARGARSYELVSRTLLTQVACQSGGLEEAVTHLRRAQEILSNGEDWRGLAAEVHLAEGILATAQQRWPEAEAAFQKAAAINRQYHLPYYEARSLFEWGQMYLSRNGPGDRGRGMELLGQSLAIFQRIQARKMVEKVAALQEQIQSRPRRGDRPVTPTYPDGLTQREVEVLCLIAQGKTDREIAEELVISFRTVGNHVSNILNKTNTANRTEAATYAARHGLV